MLVLSRRKEQSVVIDGQIEIEVLKISGNTVRLGIKAPRQVKVLRGELAPYGKSEFTIDVDPATMRQPASELQKSKTIAQAG